MMDTDSISNIACNILQLTNDGDSLSSNDLQLVEGAVNGFLSPRGEVVLIQLKYKCENGYELPAFCGVENLTRGTNGDRSVFWKGIRVEHYDHDFWCSKGWQKDMKKDAEHLGRVCQYLENNSIPVSMENYMDNVRKVK